MEVQEQATTARGIESRADDDDSRSRLSDLKTQASSALSQVKHSVEQHVPGDASTLGSYALGLGGAYLLYKGWRMGGLKGTLLGTAGAALVNHSAFGSTRLGHTIERFARPGALPW